MSASEKRSTVLLVEGSEACRGALVRDLESRGYAVLQAASVSEALARVKTHPVDLIAADVKLPDRSGVQLLLLLQMRPETEEVPVLLYVSSLFGGPAEDHDLPPSAVHHLRKAVDLALVADRVDELLGAVEESDRGGDWKVSRPPRARGDTISGIGSSATPEEAEAELTELRRLHAETPDDDHLMEWLAFRLYVHQRFEPAIRLLEKLIERDYRPGIQWFYLGDAHHRLGHREAALRSWAKAVEVLGDDPLAQKARLRVKMVSLVEREPERDTRTPVPVKKDHLDTVASDVFSREGLLAQRTPREAEEPDSDPPGELLI